MKEPKIDLRERTKNFALQVVRMFATLPKTTEAQILEDNRCAQAPPSAQTIARRIEVAAGRNGANGMSDPAAAGPRG